MQKVVKVEAQPTSIKKQYNSPKSSRVEDRTIVNMHSALNLSGESYQVNLWYYHCIVQHNLVKLIQLKLVEDLNNSFYNAFYNTLVIKKHVSHIVRPPMAVSGRRNTDK